MLAERAFLDYDGLQGAGTEEEEEEKGGATTGAWRKWLRHLVFSPPQDNEYGTIFLPGINDAIDRATTEKGHGKRDRRTRGRGEEGGGEREGEVQGWKDVQHEIWRVARAFDRVANVLRGSLL